MRYTRQGRKAGRQASEAGRVGKPLRCLCVCVAAVVGGCGHNVVLNRPTRNTSAQPSSPRAAAPRPLLLLLPPPHPLPHPRPPCVSASSFSSSSCVNVRTCEVGRRLFSAHIHTIAIITHRTHVLTAPPPCPQSSAGRPPPCGTTRPTSPACSCIGWWGWGGGFAIEVSPLCGCVCGVMHRRDSSS